MEDTLAIFSPTDTFTLIVGPQRQTIVTARQVLNKVPFFQRALSGGSDSFKEASERVFELPEDDPKAFADALWFTMTDHVKPIIEDIKDWKLSDEMARSYLQAWVVADKYMMEQTANNLANELVAHYWYAVVDPRQLNVLSSAILRDTEMYRFLIDEIAGQIKGCCGDGSPLKDDTGGFEELEKAEWFAIVSSLASKDHDRDFSSGDKWRNDLCTLHVHHFTEKCPEKEKEA